MSIKLSVKYPVFSIFRPNFERKNTNLQMIRTVSHLLLLLTNWESGLQAKIMPVAERC